MPDREEIRRSLNDLGSLKTPREDGIHAIFYQTNWDIVKGKITLEIQNIFLTESIPTTWGNTFLCLIPKIENPSH